jgi:hypothetical protein
MNRLKEPDSMLHDLLGIALICMGVLTMYARVTARSTELRRPPVKNPIPRSSRRSGGRRR